MVPSSRGRSLVFGCFLGMIFIFLWGGKLEEVSKGQKMFCVRSSSD